MLIRKQVNELTNQVGVERENYQARSTKEDATSSAIVFQTNASFLLNGKHANYTLSIEVQTAIDNILLQVNNSLLQIIFR